MKKRSTLFRRYLITLFMLIMLLGSFSTQILANTQTHNNIELKTGNSSATDSINHILSSGKYTTEQERKITADVANLKEFGVPIEGILVTSAKNENISYLVDFGTYTNEIYNVSRSNNGEFEFDVVDGKIKNHIFLSNGSIYVDGKKIIISEESITSDVDNELYAKRRSSWATTPPSGVKSWSYNRGRTVKKIYLNTTAGRLSRYALGAILSQAGWVGLVYGAADFAHSFGRYSTCLSFKRTSYIGNPRYLRAYKVSETLYTKANFQGASRNYTFYGYNVPSV